MRTPGNNKNSVFINSTKTLAGSNATVAVPIFGITGTVKILALYGVVTVQVGVNHTAAYFRLNDQTAQLDITLNTGTTLSAAKVGSLIVKKGLAAAAVTLKDSVAGAVSEPTTLETEYFSPIVLTQKTGGVATNIEYVYSTTDAPTTGQIQFFCAYESLSADGAVNPL